MTKNDTIMENETKTCPKCGRTLTIDNFYRRGDGSLYTYCKECVKTNNKKYRNTPPIRKIPSRPTLPGSSCRNLSAGDIRVN